MSQHAKAIVSRHETGQGSVRSYVVGFVSSIVLTLAAYTLVTHHVYRDWGLVIALATLAVVQLAVQLICFLHLGKESKPRWNLWVLLFAVMVLVIVVFGSLWIMKNLDYQHGHHNHLSPSETNQFLIHDEGYKQ